jgi:Protein of unknown function DUF262
MQKAKLLNLDPKYQRRSVWNRDFQQYFIDSIFKNYPVPPLFINLEVTKDGTTLYHVIDGKQRLTAILDFITDTFATSTKQWSPTEIAGKYFSEWDQTNQRKFFSYFLPFEFFTETSEAAVVEIFDRFNRNVQKLTDQELRHARFGGNFATLMEQLTDDPLWKKLSFFGNADVRRMRDVEYVASLFVLTMNGIVEDEDLDSEYAKYDEEFPGVGEYVARFEQTKQLVARIGNLVKETRFGNRGDFYTLWSVLLGIDGEKINWDATENSLRLFAAEVDAVPDATTDAATEDAQRYSQAVRAGTTKQQNREVRRGILIQKFVNA